MSRYAPNDPLKRELPERLDTPAEQSALVRSLRLTIQQLLLLDEEVRRPKPAPRLVPAPSAEAAASASTATAVTAKKGGRTTTIQAYLDALDARIDRLYAPGGPLGPKPPVRERASRKVRFAPKSKRRPGEKWVYYLSGSKETAPASVVESEDGVVTLAEPGTLPELTLVAGASMRIASGSGVTGGSVFVDTVQDLTLTGNPAFASVSANSATFDAVDASVATFKATTAAVVSTGVLHVASRVSAPKETPDGYVSIWGDTAGRLRYRYAGKTYDLAGPGVVHPGISAATSVSPKSGWYISGIELDANGHVAQVHTAALSQSNSAPAGGVSGLTGDGTERPSFRDIVLTGPSTSIAFEDAGSLSLDGTDLQWAASDVVTVTRLAADITSTVQALGTAASPTFAGMTVSGAATFNSVLTANTGVITNLTTTGGGTTHVMHQNAGVARWRWALYGEEGTGTDGSDLRLWSYDNAGTFVASVLNVTRAGHVDLFGPVSVGGTLGVSGVADFASDVTVNKNNYLLAADFRNTGWARGWMIEQAGVAVGGMQAYGNSDATSASLARISIGHGANPYSGTGLHVHSDNKVSIGGLDTEGYNLKVHGSTLTTGAATFNNTIAVGTTATVEGTSQLKGAVTFGKTGTSAHLASADFDANSANASGFAGSGWALTRTDDFEKYHLQVDSLTVRGMMRIYELIINQIRATNGSLWVSSSGRVETVTDNGLGSYTMTTPADTNHGFFPGDKIRVQRFTGGATVTSFMTVADDPVHTTTTWKATLDAGAPPEPGFEYVRVGSTDADRQGAVYLTADDAGAPYIDVVDGIADHTDFNESHTWKARFGKLDGITASPFGALTGYGLYAEDAYLTGGVIARHGQIGGFTILADDPDTAGDEDLSHLMVATDLYVSGRDTRITTGADTDYASTTTGIFLGMEGAGLTRKPKFRLGTALTFDGTDLTIDGAINVNGTPAATTTYADGQASAAQAAAISDANGKFASVRQTYIFDAVEPPSLADGQGGLWLKGDHLGFYVWDAAANAGAGGAVWKTYMDNAGRFYLTGTGNDYLQWDGSALSMSGLIDVSGVKIGRAVRDTRDDGAGGTIQEDGFYINTNNYHTLGEDAVARWRVGSDTKYADWDGTNLAILGDIRSVSAASVTELAGGGIQIFDPSVVPDALGGNPNYDGTDTLVKFAQMSIADIRFEAVNNQSQDTKGGVAIGVDTSATSHGYIEFLDNDGSYKRLNTVNGDLYWDGIQLTTGNNNFGVTSWGILEGGSGTYGGALTFAAGNNVTLSDGGTGDTMLISVANSPAFSGDVSVAGSLMRGDWIRVGSFYNTETPTNGNLLTTSIPYDGATVRGMFRIDVTGSAYVAGQEFVDFSVYFYAYSTGFSKVTVQNRGSYDPGTVSVSHDGSVIKLWWSNTTYYSHYDVGVVQMGHWGVSTAWYDGWTLTDAAEPATNKVACAKEGVTVYGLNSSGDLSVAGAVSLSTSTASATMLEITRTDVTKGLRLNAYDGTSGAFVLQNTFDLSAWSDMVYFHPNDGKVSLLGDLSVAGAVTVGGDIAIQADAANNSLYLGRIAALSANIDGAVYNYSLGYNTLSSLTTGDYNTALNREALASLTTGTGNFAGGYRAGYSATTGQHAVYIGYLAGTAITTGTGNVAIGGYALDVLTTDNYNAAGGYAALTALTSGAYNTAWGAWSGRGVTSTTYSAYFGAYAGDYATGNYVTALGARAGGVAGHYSTYVGYNAGVNTTGIHNTSVGHASNDAAGATGSYNTNVGSYSLSTATTGHTNTIGGYYAGFSLTTGYQNTFWGAYTGRYLTTGAGNVLMGHDTGTTLTTGSYNVLIGYNVEPSGANAFSEINIADVYKGVVGTGAEIAGTLDVTGASTLAGALTVDGESILNGLRVQGTGTGIGTYGARLGVGKGGDIAAYPGFASVQLGGDDDVQGLAIFTKSSSTFADAAVEVARFTDYGNLLIGTTTDSGYKLDVNGTARVTGAAAFEGDATIAKANAWLTLDSLSSGGYGTDQGAGISIGEGGYKGSASLHLTYTGDGYAHVGMGTVNPTTSLMTYEHIRMHYASTNKNNLMGSWTVGAAGGTTAGYTLDVTGTLGVTGTSALTGAVSVGSTLDVTGITTLDGQLTSKDGVSLTNAAATRILTYAQESWNSEEVHRWRISGTGADVVYTYFDSGEVFRIKTDYTTVSGNPNATSFIAGGTRGARVNVETATGGWSRGYVVSSNGGARAMFGGYGTGSALNYAFIDAGGDSYLTTHFRVYTDKIYTGGNAEIIGSLAVGTSSPSSKLEVLEVKDGDTRIAVRNTSGGTSARAALAAYNNTGAGAYLFATGGNYNVYSSWTGAALLSADSLLTGGIVAYSPNGFRVQNSPNSTKFSVVGGNTTVGGTLDVTGAATFSSTITLAEGKELKWSNNSLPGSVIAYDRGASGGKTLTDIPDSFPDNSLSWVFTENTDTESPISGIYGGALTYKMYSVNAAWQMWSPYNGGTGSNYDALYWRRGDYSASDFGAWYQVVLAKGGTHGKQDTDAYAEIGRAHVGYVGHADYAGFSHIDQNSTSGYALIQNSDGTTYLNSTGITYHRINNSDVMRMDTTGLRVGGGAAPTKTLDVTGTLGVSGDVVIGTTGTPVGRVNIVGSAASSALLVLDSNASYAEVQSYNSVPLYLNRLGNNTVLNSGGGSVLIGTTTDNGYKLDVTGTMRATGTATFDSDINLSNGGAIKSGDEYALEYETVGNSLWLGRYTAKPATLDSAVYNFAALYLSLNSLTTGDYNTAIGYSTLRYTTTGYNNLAIGREALRDNTTGYSNIALGSYAGRKQGADLSYTINVGYSAGELGTNSYVVNIGGFAGTYSGAGAVNVGYLAGRYNTGTFNVTIGYAANDEVGATGSFNTLVGSYSGSALTTGYNNAGFGYATLYQLTTGYANVALGRDAGYAVTSGYNNALVGYQAGAAITTGHHNTATGYHSLRYVSTADYNTTLGAYSGDSITTGNGNVLIGYSTGNTLVTGSHNVLIGYDVEPSGASASNEINIGNVYKGVVGTGADITGTLSVSGAATFSGHLSSPSFTSGIFGAGWRLDGTYLELDDLFVRNTLRAHIFQKDIVRAVNGYLYFANSAAISQEHVVVSGAQVIRLSEQVFQLGDLIWYKGIDDAGTVGVKFSVDTDGDPVVNAEGETVYEYTVICESGVGATLKVGGTITQVGSADPGRQGSMLFDASSQYAPFLDIYDGVDSWSAFGTADKLKLRAGNLSGITSPSFGPLSGYGIYTNRGFFERDVVVAGTQVQAPAGVSHIWHFDDGNLSSDRGASPAGAAGTERTAWGYMSGTDLAATHAVGLYGGGLRVDPAATNLLSDGETGYGSGTGWDTWSDYTGAVVTRTPGQEDPAGGSGAVRFTSTGGTNALKTYVSAGSAPNGVTWYTSVWVKAIKPVYVYSSHGGEHRYVQPSEGWVQVRWSVVGNGSGTVQIQLRATNAAGDGLDVNGELDCYVFQPQIEAGSGWTAFVPGTRAEAGACKLPIKASTSWTIAMWFRCDIQDDSVFYVYDTRVDDAASATALYYNAGSLVLYSHDGTLGSTGSTTYAPGAWTHVAVTHTPESDGEVTKRLYVDGELATTDKAPIPDLGGDLWLGSRYTEASQLGGVIDELVLADRPLSASEIYRLAKSEAPVSTSPGQVRIGGGQIWGSAIQSTGYNGTAGARLDLDAGNLMLGGATAFGTGDGVWLGSDGQARFGTPGTSEMKYDGSAIIVGQSSAQHVKAEAGALSVYNKDASDNVFRSFIADASGTFMGDYESGNYFHVNTEGTVYQYQGSVYRSLLNTTGMYFYAEAGATNQTYWRARLNTDGLRLRDVNAVERASFTTTVTIGRVAADKFNTYITDVGFYVRENTTSLVKVEGSAGGRVQVGKDAAANVVMTDSGFYVKANDGSTILSQWEGSTITLGKTGTGLLNTQITDAKIAFRENTTEMASMSSSLIRMGQTGAGNSRVDITPADIEVWDKFENRVIHAASDGSLTVGDGDTENVYFGAGKLQFRNGTTMHGSLSGSAWTLGPEAGEHIEILASGVYLYKNATEDWFALEGGLLRMGQEGDDRVQVTAGKIAMLDENDVERFKAEAGALTIGQVAASKLNTEITDAKIAFRENTTELASMSGSLIRMGQTGQNRFEITSTELRGYAGNNERFKITSAGEITVGDGNGENLLINSGTLALRAGTSVLAHLTGTTFKVGDHLVSTATGTTISGWDLNAATISKGNIVLDSAGSIRHDGGAWGLYDDGSASLGNGGFTIDAEGRTRIAHQQWGLITAVGDTDWHAHWAGGASTMPTGWNYLGALADNNIVIGAGPFGVDMALWEVTARGVNSSDGGPTSDKVPVDPAKPYRFHWLIRRSELDGGTFCGFYAFNDAGSNIGARYRSNASTTTNGYFLSNKDFPDDDWYLVVAYFYPEGSPQTTDRSGGVYHVASGKKVMDVDYEYVWLAGTTSVQSRCWLYYTTTTTPKQYVAGMGVYEVDGTEPSIWDLIGGSGATLAQNLLSAPTIKASNMYFGDLDAVASGKFGVHLDANNHWYDTGAFSLAGAEGIRYAGSGNVLIGSDTEIDGDVLMTTGAIVFEANNSGDGKLFLDDPTGSKITTLTSGYLGRLRLESISGTVEIRASDAEQNAFLFVEAGKTASGLSIYDDDTTDGFGTRLYHNTGYGNSRLSAFTTKWGFEVNGRLVAGAASGTNAELYALSDNESRLVLAERKPGTVAGPFDDGWDLTVDHIAGGIYLRRLVEHQGGGTEIDTVIELSKLSQGVLDELKWDGDRVAHGAQAAHINNEGTTVTLTGTYSLDSDTISDKLEALSAKVNSLIAALEAFGITAT